MTAAERIKEILLAENIPFIEDDNHITVPAASTSGFDVVLFKKPELTVYFDGWHEAFDSEDKAFLCFMLGLSDGCRLQVTYRGDKPYKWVLEWRPDGAWQPDSVTGHLCVPFWRKSKIVYLQNSTRPNNTLQLTSPPQLHRSEMKTTELRRYSNSTPKDDLK